MDHKTSLMEFPCDFPIKIMGKNHEHFYKDIVGIVRRHYPNLADTAVRSQPSKQGNYLALSITVPAENQASLDALYLELTKHPDITMVL